MLPEDADQIVGALDDAFPLNSNAHQDVQLGFVGEPEGEREVVSLELFQNGISKGMIALTVEGGEYAVAEYTKYYSGGEGSE